MANENAKELGLCGLLSLQHKSEENLYEMALTEMQGESRRNGLWARALSEAMGDERKTEALYIGYRVEQLTTEQGTQRRTALEAERAERAEQVVFDCPKCGNKLRLTKGKLSDFATDKSAALTFSCPKCREAFDGWPLIPVSFRTLSTLEAERAEPVVFDCPKCGNKLNLTQEKLSELTTGKCGNWTHSCPSCGETFDGWSFISTFHRKLSTLPPVKKLQLEKDVAGVSVSKKQTGLATASLICGICGLAYPVSILFLVSIAGIICGHIAMSRIRDKPAVFDGLKRAKAGLIISYIALALGLGLSIAMGFMRASINSSLYQMGH